MASPDDEHRMTAAGASHHGQREGLFRMLSDAARRPTAVFAAGYELALDVYAAAAQAGLRIPHDLSVVGIDDPPSAAFLQPALTTLRAPLIELGKMAVAAMSDLMRYEAAAVKARTLHAQLVERGSTAPIE